MKDNYRKTWIEVDLTALYKNYQIAQKAIGDKKIIPVVKANAYGHGMIEVMRFLVEKGVSICAVSLLEEAVSLREHFKDIKILILGVVSEDDFDVVSNHKLDMTINNLATLKAVLKYDQKLNCHLKVDTGMARYGILDPKEVVKAVNKLQKHPTVKLEGIYTHLAIVDENEAYADRQLEKMRKIIQSLTVKPPMIHISNSSATFMHEHKLDFTTHVRLGISLYGLSLNPYTPILYPVMKLKTTIVQIRLLKPGDCVGYGANYCPIKPENIGVLPLGYADGFLRRNKDGKVEINGKIYQLVGRICMEACFVKLDDEVKVGDSVTVFGGLIEIDEIARHNQTINYEIVTTMSSRIQRRYLRGEIK